MKNLFKSIFFLSIILLAGLITISIVAGYQYKRDILSNWCLADKSSTISQKAFHIDAFVVSLQTAELQGEYDAVFMKTPNNSFDENMNALKSLQYRLHEIQNLDPNSFEYNTAIQQIAAQEQGEARAMLNVFWGCWLKHNYIVIWNWVAGVIIITLGIAFIVSTFGLIAYSE